jgi:hypothetical protein
MSASQTKISSAISFLFRGNLRACVPTIEIGSKESMSVPSDSSYTAFSNFQSKTKRASPDFDGFQETGVPLSVYIIVDESFGTFDCPIRPFDAKVASLEHKNDTKVSYIRKSSESCLVLVLKSSDTGAIADIADTKMKWVSPYVCCEKDSEPGIIRRIDENPSSCVPLWGLTMRGIFQAFRVHTVAIKPKTKGNANAVDIGNVDSDPLRTAEYCFFIPKPTPSSTVPPSVTNSVIGTTDKENDTFGLLSIDFRDFSNAVAM